VTTTTTRPTTTAAKNFYSAIGRVKHESERCTSIDRAFVDRVSIAVNREFNDNVNPSDVHHKYSCRNAVGVAKALAEALFTHLGLLMNNC